MEFFIDENDVYTYIVFDIRSFFFSCFFLYYSFHLDTNTKWIIPCDSEFS